MSDICLCFGFVIKTRVQSYIKMRWCAILEHIISFRLLKQPRGPPSQFHSLGFSIAKRRFFHQAHIHLGLAMKIAAMLTIFSQRVHNRAPLMYGDCG